MADNQPYGFTGRSVKRIGAAVKRIEGLPLYSKLPVPQYVTRRIAPGAGTNSYARNLILTERKETTDDPAVVYWCDQDLNVLYSEGTELVHDPHQQFMGFGNAYGRAIKVRDLNEWQFTHLQGPALLLVAYLDQALVGANETVNATVPNSTYWGDVDWLKEKPGDDYVTIQVQSPPGIPMYLGTDDYVVAVRWDTTTDPVTYLIVETGNVTTHYIAKISGNIPPREEHILGTGLAQLGILVAGEWVPVLPLQLVYNPALSEVNVGSDYLLMPVDPVNDHWVLNPTELPQVTGWEPQTELHLRQCEAEGYPSFAAMAPIIAFNSITYDGTCEPYWITDCGTGTVGLECFSTSGTLGTLGTSNGLDCESYGTAEVVTSIDCDENGTLTYTTIIISLPCGTQ